MECDICSREASLKLPFHCVACARGSLYEARLATAQLLIEKAKLGKQLENIVGPQSVNVVQKPGLGNQTVDPARTWAMEMLEAQKKQAKENRKAIQSHAVTLRDELRSAKEDMEKSKAKIAARKAEMDAITAYTPDRRRGAAESMITATEKFKHAWESVHHKGAENRNFLCREAARLYRLSQKKKMRGGVARDQYTIGGIPIVDLREINSMPAWRMILLSLDANTQYRYST